MYKICSVTLLVLLQVSSEMFADTISPVVAGIWSHFVFCLWRSRELSFIRILNLVSVWKNLQFIHHLIWSV